MDRTLMERARKMLSHMQVDKIGLREAVNTAVYVTYRVPCASHNNVTSHEVINGRKPDPMAMRVFGTKGYAHVDKLKSTKLNKNRFRCLFLGYYEQI
ncbi:hypothetical protein DD238_001213 [Peronospora effusa]|uniref:Uncharacterized protein n=1 Tax=Peronospora effusa TaxID=542832 RepID=A0A3M6VSS4_9STRA|nr:hypothetical protein DD238_001213 [Peronospora effusa]RQM18823.1 hypothetical protein DD237_002610 [Peronospora effusa]